MNSNLVYDIRGSAFSQGVTNFTVDNYLKAKQQFGLADKSYILLFHTALHSKLKKSGVLQVRTCGTVPFFDCAPVIYTDHAEYIDRYTYVTSFVSLVDHTLCKMITREA